MRMTMKTPLTANDLISLLRGDFEARQSISLPPSIEALILQADPAVRKGKDGGSPLHDVGRLPVRVVASRAEP